MAAVYFPPTTKKIRAITTKFESDLAASKTHNRDGFVFITNQRITEANEKKLIALALAEGKECFVLHRERLRVLLDSPEGYGIRTSYLGIPMEPEEQFSFFSDESRRVMRTLDRNSEELQRLISKVELTLQGQDYVKQTLETLTGGGPSRSSLPVSGNFVAEPLVGKMSDNISPALLVAMHRLVCADLPSRMIGRFRDVLVWVGSPRSPTRIPMPAAADVAALVKTLCDDWNAAYESIERGRPAKKLRAVAEFHARLLHIHPFLDGNGRLARAVLMQQCVDLFGGADMSLLQKGTEYFAALEEADEGRLENLIELIRPILLARDA